MDSHAFSRTADNFIKNAVQFEKEFKDRLKWNRQCWKESGEMNSRMNKLCNSIHYWKDKLKPAVEDVSIVITLYNKLNDVRVEIVDIIEAIESLNNSFIVKGIANFRNPRYICIYFENREIRDKVKELFGMLNDNYVVYLSWALGVDEKQSKLTVHWLPITLSVEIIKNELEKYVVCVEHVRKKLKFLSGREMPTARIEFRITYNDSVTAEQVPHLLNINNMEALVTIGGRKPLCLNCDRMGHISKECDLRFCSVCRTLKKKKHNCDVSEDNRSYADIVKDSKNGNDLLDPDLADQTGVFIEKKQIIDNKKIIEERISTLEDKLKTSNTYVGANELDRPEKKRKAENVEIESDAEQLSTKNVDSEGEESSNDANMDGESEEDSWNVDLEQDMEAQMENNYGKDKLAEDFDIVQKRQHKKKKIKSKNKATKSEDNEVSIAGNQTLLLGMTTRSYGKPVPNNARKLKEEARFLKCTQLPEFVFKDIPKEK